MEAIHTAKAPAAIGPYSQAIRAKGFIFVSGQIPLIPETGEMAGPDFQDQARQALENMKQILKAANCGLDNVVSVDVYITDMARFGTFNEIYGTYFSEHKPSRAVVEVRALPKGAMIEVKCIAAAE